MTNGVLPYAAMLDNDSYKIDIYLEGIYNTIIVKYIEARQNRKEKKGEKRKITDIAF